MACDWPKTDAWQAALQDNLNEKYVPISCLSENLCFAVPRAKAAAIANTNDLAEIKNQLAAIKVPRHEDTHAGEMAREIVHHKKIRERAAESSRPPRIPMLLDSGNSDPALCKWFSMPAVTSCLDLEQIHENIKVPIHPGFLVHMFFQIMPALDFLNETCEIAHVDMGWGQILIDNAHQDVPGLPNLLLTDFGLSRSLESTESHNIPVDASTMTEVDRSICCFMHYDFFQDCRNCSLCDDATSHEDCPNAEGWKEFDEFLQCLRTWGPQSFNAPLWKDIQSRFENLIQQSSTAKGLHMTDQDLKDLQETLRSISEPRTKRIETDILNWLANAKSTSS